LIFRACIETGKKESKAMNKVWIGDDNKGTVNCPKCLFGIAIDATKFQNKKRELKAKCKCGEIFQFTIEFRTQYRKDVMLPGEYSIQGKKGEIIIRDLSMSGVRFECFMPSPISADDTLEVTFKLNNPSGKEIRKTVKVVWVNGFMVGAKFIERKLYEKDLGFYLKY
jgi:hypothetical protein